jgi:predicted enzyme related to lactoylglutathione lyase
MVNKLSHFAIHATDVERAKEFYGKIFDWDFQAYGPPDFVQIKPRGGSSAPMGAIQSRKYNVIGQDLLGFECTISVDDVEATARAVDAAGGVILMPKTVIPSVCWIIKFRDTEGNVVCAAQYDPTAR